MSLAQKCLQCGAEVALADDGVACGACGARWPVVRGVPAYRAAAYFGEISQEDMIVLNHAAEQTHWRQAVRERFEESNPDMYHYVADLNRASWIPLLPIGPDSTVLDVGSGLGALTHALALSYDHVVSIEPVEERVRFTQIRLEQEGLKNVTLIQTALDALPFFEETFDLIVLNGILEWVGVWRRDGSPRQAQRDILQTIRRLLKPHGRLLIGVENRIGFESFLGRMDHPGTRFTSLLPRALASLYLKVRRPGFYRTLLDASQGYRTYTYSPRGYRKLLREAGFESVDFWWPPQGYNLPHELFRLADRRVIRRYVTCDRNYKDRVHGRAWHRTVKHWALVKTGLIFAMTPDVVIFAKPARPNGKSETPDDAPLLKAVGRVLDFCPGAHPAALLSAGFRNKTIVKFMAPDGRAIAIAKIAHLKEPGADAVQQGYDLLARLQPVFDADGAHLRGTTPVPLRLLSVGSWMAGVESAAPGQSLEDLSMEPGYFSDRDTVTHQLDRIAAWLTAAQPRLARLASHVGEAIPLAWRQVPGTPSQAELSWVQHGDFYAGNIFWQKDAARLCVIDWDQCAAGYPPLFDWFCLVSSLYYTHVRTKRLPAGHTVDGLSFRQTYFERGWFADAVRTLTHRLCDLTGLDAARTADYFHQYLLVRHRQFDRERDVSRKGIWADHYRACHEFFQTHRKRCIFHGG